MRKLRGRKDSGIAIKAGARKLAIAYYNALTKGTAYVEQGTKLYEEQIKRREMAALKKLMLATQNLPLRLPEQAGPTKSP